MSDSKRAVNEAISILDEVGIDDDSGWYESYKKNAVNGISKRLKETMNNCHPGQVILELGSAPFIYTKALDILGYNVIATDIAPERFSNREKLGLNIIKVNYDLEKLPIENDSIDYIICDEVFEHMRGNLIFTFGEFYRVLKPGGIISLSTPNLHSIQGISNFLFNKKSYSCANDLFIEWDKINKIGHMGHIREYTDTEVTEFLSRIGFQLSGVKYSNLGLNDGIKHKFVKVICKLIPSYSNNMTILMTK